MEGRLTGSPGPLGGASESREANQVTRAPASHMTTPAERRFDVLVLAEPERAIAAHRALTAALEEGGVAFANGPLPTSLKPHFIDQSVQAAWCAEITRLFAALEGVGRQLLQDRTLYDRLGLPPAARALVEIDPGYRSMAVVARPDVLWSGAKAALVEINTDSPAMMVFADCVQEAQRGLFPLDEVLGDTALRFDARTPRMLEALLECYRESGGEQSAPTIAVVDWPGVATRHEQAELARRFTALGTPSFVTHPALLRIHQGRLHGRDPETGLERAIDIVQRRVLFPDFISRAAELGPLMEAYAAGTVCMVNPLRSYLLGSKAVLALLHAADVQSDLSPELVEAVQSMVPETHLVDPGLCARLESDRADWVLKEAFGYGGKGVVLGSESDRASWLSALRDSCGGGWVAQRAVAIPTYQLPVVEELPGEGAKLSMASFYANWNPFVFGGRCAGAITRASAAKIVSITARGALLPAIGDATPQV